MSDDIRTVSSDAVYTVPQTAKILRISRQKAYQLIHASVIPSFCVEGSQINVPGWMLKEWMTKQSLKGG